MDQARAELIAAFYGQSVIHYASSELPYYANLLPSLVIHETRPEQTRPDALYITNGLSLPNEESATGYGIEFQMIAPPEKSWPVTLLISLAAYVLRTDHRFSYGQSIALTHNLTGIEDTLNALVFARAPGLPAMLCLLEGNIRLITVVGITAEEHEWARRYSAHTLVALMQLCGQGVATLPGRRSVVPGPEPQFTRQELLGLRAVRASVQ